MQLSWIVALTADPNTIVYQVVYQLLAQPQSPLVFPGAPPPQQQQQQQQSSGEQQQQTMPPYPGAGTDQKSFKAMNNDMSPQYTAPSSMQTPAPANISSPPVAQSAIPAAMPVAGVVAAGAGGGPQLRAKALYSYTGTPVYSFNYVYTDSSFMYIANPDDPNELTFEKGEQFMVLDNKGKWWQVQTPAGKVGIVPSNYMQLIQ